MRTRRPPAAAPTCPAAEPVGDGVWKVTGGAFPSNAYLCEGGPHGEAFVIDPGLDPERIDGAARALGLKPGKVFCTHGHFDHIGGASWFQQAYGCEVFLHQADVKTMTTGNLLLMVLKIEQRITLPEVTLVDPGSPPPMPVTYTPVPGHTPGSCFIGYGGHTFTGDSLYSRGVGLSDLPGENHDLLRQSLLELWDAIPGDQMVHPGHGPSARFEAIRDGNAALREFLAGEARR